MTWRAINYGTAANEHGTIVARVGFRDLKYERNGQHLVIDVEPGLNDLAVYARGIKHWLPSGRPIDSTEREAIVRDVKAALTVLRVPVMIMLLATFGFAGWGNRHRDHA
jgi:hypothetical protein